MPLSDALKGHAQNRPGAYAAVIDNRVVTYGTLADRATRINAFISRLPRVKRRQSTLDGKPVFALLMGNHPHVVEFLAAALAGQSCVVLLDPLLPEQRVADILDRLTPDILFTAGQKADRFGNRGFPVVSIETDDDLTKLLQGVPKTRLPAPDKDDPFLVAFTSGTTSHPKAFARTRRSWRASLAAGKDHFQLGPDTHTLSPGPLAHGLSLYAFAETLEAGATFHALEKFTPAKAWAMLENHALARLVCVPSVLDALCRHHDRADATLAALAQVTTSGAKLTDPVLDRLKTIAPHANVTEYYGASELGFVTSITHRPAESGYIQGRTGVGRAFPGVEIEVREVDAVTPQDGFGTIWVKSDLMIDGYLWHDDNVAFRREGRWATVGDIGRMDASGDLHLVSRAGGMIISGGNNIYPEEIAACLRRHSAIKDACVLGRPDTYLGKKLVAVLSIEPDKIAPSLEELLTFCTAKLQKYKVPRQFYIVSEWPMTSSGKISTAQLEEWMTVKDDRLVLL